MTTIAFLPLSAVPPETVLAHMTDPRAAAHLPLMPEGWTLEDARGFIADKEAARAQDGIGHQAILIDGGYAGWGGFARDGAEWDLALVLHPDHFGRGPQILRLLIAEGRADPRIGTALILLAPSRRAVAGMARIGAESLGEVERHGARFLGFRLDLAAAPDRG